MNWPSLSLFSSKPLPVCKGKINVGANTNAKLRDLQPGRIVVLRQCDLDEDIAQKFIDRKVKAVINCQETMSGSCPTEGPLMLLQMNISIWEVETDAYDRFAEQLDVSIYEQMIVYQGCEIPCKAFTREDWLFHYQNATNRVTQQLSKFIDNTLTYALQQKHAVIDPLPLIALRTDLAGKPILIVSKGKGCKQDLMEARAFIHEICPILIGVEDGADVLLECGYRPHVIIGDMASVTDHALTCGAELVVHNNRDENGVAPGLVRIHAIGREAHLLSCFGTSEDAALLLAFEKQGEWLITVGAHAHMMDFMEKGRAGMGSTLLVRLKLGAKVIDIKSVGVLFRRSTSRLKDAWVTLLLSLGLIALSLMQMSWITKKLSHVVWNWGGHG
ncbi:putative cytokinetic ring protein SteA [Paenibacillus sp. SI8]|uniref:putative cytokinetic ring protein SteA n=1 Tax=unclassified Paenibacillus TaxID=185978 RepID=UPI00346683F5